MKSLLIYICLIYTFATQAQSEGRSCMEMDSMRYGSSIIAGFNIERNSTSQIIPIILLEGNHYTFHICNGNSSLPLQDTVKVTNLENKPILMNLYEESFFANMSLRNRKTQVVYLTIYGAQKLPTGITLTADFSSEKGNLIHPYLTPWRALVFNKNDEITHYLNELRNRVAAGEANAPIAIEDILEEMRAKGFNIEPIIEALEYKPFFMEQKKKY